MIWYVSTQTRRVVSVTVVSNDTRTGTGSATRYRVKYRSHAHAAHGEKFSLLFILFVIRLGVFFVFL